MSDGSFFGEEALRTTGVPNRQTESTGHLLKTRRPPVGLKMDRTYAHHSPVDQDCLYHSPVELQVPEADIPLSHLVHPLRLVAWKTVGVGPDHPPTQRDCSQSVVTLDWQDHLHTTQRQTGTPVLAGVSDSSAVE